jgi:hypothetical protein
MDVGLVFCLPASVGRGSGSGIDAAMAGHNRYHRADARRQGGYGDYTAKKKEGEPGNREKILPHNTYDQAGNQILSGLIRIRDKAIQMATVVSDCFKYCRAKRVDSLSLYFQLGQNIMNRLIHFWQRLLGASVIDPDDHLMGALDLSDTAYCAALLARHSAP